MKLVPKEDTDLAPIAPEHDVNALENSAREQIAGELDRHVTTESLRDALTGAEGYEPEYQTEPELSEEQRLYEEDRLRALREAKLIGVQPIYDSIVVQQDPPKTISKGGITIPDEYKERPCRGTVLAVARCRLFLDGKTRPMAVKPQDRVVFGFHSGNPMPEDEFGPGIRVLREEELLGFAIEPDDEPAA